MVDVHRSFITNTPVGQPHKAVYLKRETSRAADPLPVRTLPVAVWTVQYPTAGQPS